MAAGLRGFIVEVANLALELAIATRRGDWAQESEVGGRSTRLTRRKLRGERRPLTGRGSGKEEEGAMK